MRFSTNKYYIYDNQKENSWLCNEVEVDEIVEVMNNLDIKAKERSKGMSTLQKKYDKIIDELKKIEKEKQDLESELEELNGLVDLIAHSYSVIRDVSVKEVLRDEIDGLDTVAENSYNAWNDYVRLSNFYDKKYGKD